MNHKQPPTKEQLFTAHEKANKELQKIARMEDSRPRRHSVDSNNNNTLALLPVVIILMFLAFCAVAPKETPEIVVYDNMVVMDKFYHLNGKHTAFYITAREDKAGGAVFDSLRIDEETFRRLPLGANFGMSYNYTYHRVDGIQFTYKSKY